MKKSKHYWAYGVDRNGSAVLVRCKSFDDAQEEMQRMKMSDAVRVGASRRKGTEAEARRTFKTKGWDIKLVRDFVPCLSYVE